MARSPCDDCAEALSSCPTGFERPYRRPFLVGVYLATNAIADAVTIVDGPDCAFFKAEFIHGKHDFQSTLLDVTGKHRILPSQVTTDDLATSRGQRATDLARRAAAKPETSLVLVTAMPLVTITGAAQEGLVRELQPEVDADLVAIPGRSLQGDWLSGYEETLAALAKRLVADLAADPAATGTVDQGEGPSISVIGYLMDRNEEDHRGNVRELRRLVAGLGLDLDSIWLSGQPWPELRRAGRSTILVALPMGRAAARILAAATGARLIEVDPPFGLARTERFVKALAAATGREQRASELCETELETALPRLEWAVPHTFLGKQVVFFGAPDLLAGFYDLATELGMSVMAMGCPAERPTWHAWEQPAGLTVTFDVPPETAYRSWWQHGGPRPDLVVGNTDALERLPADTACVELGYPSYRDHAYFDRPFLGYRGYLAFVQRMATALGMGFR